MCELFPWRLKDWIIKRSKITTRENQEGGKKLTIGGFEVDANAIEKLIIVGEHKGLTVLVDMDVNSERLVGVWIKFARVLVLCHEQVPLDPITSLGIVTMDVSPAYDLQK